MLQKLVVHGVGRQDNPPLDFPEDYLWAHYSDGSRRFFADDRLWELCEGAMPKDGVEAMLSNDREWLRIYLTHARGEYTVAVTEGEPLGAWDPSWLDSVES